MRMRFLTFRLIAFAIIPGCDAGAPVEEVKATLSRGDPVLATTRTENGVVVYEYAPDAFDKAPQWSLEGEPVTVIGGADGDPQYDLTWATYVVPLSDGRLMTFARVGNKVFVFGRDGTSERTIGRTGQGPGDWMRFGDPVLLENDTVLVLDFANARLNWVTADGGVVRTTPYVAIAGTRGSNIAGFMSTGELLLHTAGVTGAHQSDSTQRSLAEVSAANITTGELRSLPSIPDVAGVLFETRFRGRVMKEWQRLRLAGVAKIEAWDSLYASATASSRSIELRDAAGAIRGRIVVPATRRPVTRQMRDAQVKMELGWLDGGGEPLVDRDESERLAREAPFADSLPYFSYFKTGSDGTLWVVDAIAPSDTGWTATGLLTDGSILARLTVKHRSLPMVFGANQVILRAEDDNGVVSLRVHRFSSTP